MMLPSTLILRTISRLYQGGCFLRHQTRSVIQRVAFTYSSESAGALEMYIYISLYLE